jgi:hypothetical protein
MSFDEYKYHKSLIVMAALIDYFVHHIILQLYQFGVADLFQYSLTMWSRSALRIASYGRTYSVSYRPFTYNSLHKRALKALSNKQQSAASPPIETNDKTTLNNEKTSPPLNENVQENTETQVLKEEEDVVSSPKPILAAATPTAAIRTPPPPSQLHEFAPRIVVCGVGGGGGNAINNMISKELQGMLYSMHIVLLLIVCLAHSSLFFDSKLRSRLFGTQYRCPTFVHNTDGSTSSTWSRTDSRLGLWREPRCRSHGC